MSKISELKYQDESWHECAVRLGRDARYEGKPTRDNPFPKNGFLHGVWLDSWIGTDADLKADRRAIPKVLIACFIAASALLVSFSAKADSEQLRQCLKVALDSYKSAWAKKCPGGYMVNAECDLPRYIAAPITADFDRITALCIAINGEDK